MIVKYKKLHPDAKIPTFAHSTDAGMDIFCIKKTTLAPQSTTLISTGIASECDTEYVFLIWDKSGLGAQGLHVFGGVIDAGYRGEWKILVYNTNKVSYIFEKGDKIAQALVQKVENPKIVLHSQLSDSERGDGGFGSTGLK